VCASTAAALVCSQAVRAAVFARMLGERLSRIAWLGTAMALLGVLSVTGVDVSLSSRTLAGDLLAFLGGVFGGAYILAGGLVRRRLSTTAYTAVCYAACAVSCLRSACSRGRRSAGTRARTGRASRRSP
jgi:drug/metabolite transporter (DMT)-like permease